MRRPVLTLAAALAASPAFAQTPPVPPIQPARNDVLPTPGSGTPAGVQPGGLPVGLPVGQSPAPAIDPALKTHLDAWERPSEGSRISTRRRT